MIKKGATALMAFLILLGSFGLEAQQQFEGRKMKKSYLILTCFMLFLLSGCKKDNTKLNQEEVVKTTDEYQCIINVEIPLLDVANERISMNENGYVIAKRENDKTSIIHSAFEGSTTEIVSFDYDTHVVDLDMNCDSNLAILIKDESYNYVVLIYDLKGTKTSECQVKADSASGEILSKIKYIDSDIYLTGKKCIYKLDNELNISHCYGNDIGELVTTCDVDKVAIFYDGKSNFGYTIFDAKNLKKIESVSFKEERIWRTGKKNIYYQKGDMLIKHDRLKGDVELFSAFQFDIDTSKLIYFSDCGDGYIFMANANDDSISVIVMSYHDVSPDINLHSESNISSDLEETGNDREEIKFLGVNTSLYQGFSASYNKANNLYRLKVLPAVEDWKVYNVKLLSEKYDLFEVDAVDYFNYVEKGYLLDVRELIESSEDVDLKEYFDVAINTFLIDGKIYAVPKEMEMINLFVPTPLIGEKSSWTVDDFLVFMEKYPNCLSRDYHQTAENAKCSILNYILYGSVSELIRDGRLNSKEFASILERVNKLNISITTDSEKRRIENGEPLIYKKYIASADDFSKLQSETQSELTIMGFPTLNGVTSEGIICFYDMVGISVNTDNISGAWDVVEKFLARPVSKNHSAVPTKMDEFEDKMKEGMDREPYIIDGVYYVPVSDSDVEKVKNAYSHTHILSDLDRSIFEIVLDSSANYFLGDISLEQTVDNIEKRVNILLNERK